MLSAAHALLYCCASDRGCNCTNTLAALPNLDSVLIRSQYQAFHDGSFPINLTPHLEIGEPRFPHIRPLHTPDANAAILDATDAFARFQERTTSFEQYSIGELLFRMRGESARAFWARSALTTCGCNLHRTKDEGEIAVDDSSMLSIHCNPRLKSQPYLFVL